jgi:hypothetical protein
MDGGAVTYAYDGEGRRMKKVTSTETTYILRTRRNHLGVHDIERDRNSHCGFKREVVRRRQ